MQSYWETTVTNPERQAGKGAVQYLNSDEECFASVSSGLGWTAFLLFAKAEPVKN